MAPAPARGRWAPGAGGREKEGTVRGNDVWEITVEKLCETVGVALYPAVLIEAPSLVLPAGPILAVAMAVAAATRVAALNMFMVACEREGGGVVVGG